MPTRALTKSTGLLPSVFNDFFKPWNEWFDGGSQVSRATIPSVNITENKNDYKVSLAAPGLKKEDFKIDMDGNVLTISSEKEEEKKESEDKYTRREYSYSSFSRSFSLPDDVNKDAIEAKYENGVLNIMLPRKEEAKQATAAKQIAVK